MKRKLCTKWAGLFSFKNFQLMSITDSLYRSSDFACALPHGCQLNVDSKVAGTRRVPSALHFWVDGTGRVPTTFAYV